MCRVCLGKSFLQFSAIRMAHAPPGHHSVIGRPSNGGLCYPEYVVYRGEQVCSPFVFGPLREKSVVGGFANNKGADQPAHPRSLTSAFVIR